MTIQVEDDIALLDQMLADQERGGARYSATARWDGYSRVFADFLREVGLRDFRKHSHPKGSPGHVLHSFGAVDGLPVDTDWWKAYGTAANAFVPAGARTIDQLAVSQVGNPNGFEVEGRFYTLSWLNFFHRYAYVSKYFDFTADNIIVELGSGSGKQAELLRKAHPHSTIVLFDLPTQLYVANQYLTKVFEGDDGVVPYQVARDFTSLDDVVRGKINVLGSWQYDLLQRREIDLFWNAASLQEMAPPMAKRYLRKAGTARHLFLMHFLLSGEGMSVPGRRKVIGSGAMRGFVEVDRTHARHCSNRDWPYFDSFWTRADLRGISS